MRTVILTALLCAACGPAEQPPREAAVESAEQPLICGAEDWQPIDAAAEGPLDAAAVLANYGKAVAATSEACSGFLINPVHFVTAAHCGAEPTITVTFGETVGTTDVLAYGRQRLAALGATSPSSAAHSELTQFICDLREQFDTDQGNGDEYDVLLYECRRRDMGGAYKVRPGDIWGWVNDSLNELDDNDALSIVSVNTPTNSNVEELLLSNVGVVLDADDSCVGIGPITPVPGNQCFEHSLDTLGGTSGAPVFDDRDFTVVGVHSAHRDFGFGSACGVLRSNYASYLPPDWKDDFHVQALPRPAMNAVQEESIGIINAHQKRTLSCPGELVAAGVIGTTNPSGSVGNFGIVCAPLQNTTNSFYRDTGSWRVVVTSSDGSPGAGSFDYNTYLNEHLDPEDAFDFLEQWQAVQMCRPGYYLSGVRARETAAGVAAIERIKCYRYDAGSARYYFPSAAQDNDIGTNAGTSETNLHCNIGRRFVQRFVAYEDGKLRGLTVHCADL